MITTQFQNTAFRFIQIQPGTKKPIALVDWQKKGLLFDDPKISEWLESNKPVGIISGFGGLMAVDDDTDDGEIATICRNTLPPTYAEKTGSGKVRHFFIIEGYDDNRDYIKLGIGEKDMGELRFRDSQCLIAPSLHPSGKRYEPANDNPIAAITWSRMKEIFGPWITEKSISIDVTADNSDIDKQKLEEVLNAVYIKPLMDGSTSGFKSRSEAEMALVTRLGMAGVSKAQVLDVMAKCKIGKWQESNSKYKELTLNKAFTTAKKYYKPKEEPIPDWKQFFDWKENRDGDLVISRFVSKRMGDYIIEHMPIVTLKENGRMYRYENGYYREDGEPTVKAEVNRILGEAFSQQRQNETLSYIRSATYRRNSEANMHNWINLNNGLLDPITGEFKNHTPSIFTTGRTPITYDPSASCHFWLSKLADKVDERTVKILQEMMGYLFQRGQKYEAAFLFYGPPRTMKSTVLWVAEQLIGAENTMAYPLQQLNDDHFSLAYLYGKRANICADLDSHSLRNTARFMQLVGGDMVTAGKKYEDAFSFYPDCKLLFSCNIIPGTSNKDLSFYRRWIILEFNKQTEAKDIDPDMRDKMSAELPGILNWAIEGLRRIKANKGFSYWLTPEQVKDLYERASDSVTSFIVNNIELGGEDDRVTKRDVYAEYANYCIKNRLRPLNQVWFGRDFLANTGCGTGKLDGLPAYVGIKFSVRTVPVEIKVGITTTTGCGLDTYLPQARDSN